MKRSRRMGFTLIELLVVMGILMFLFGLGVAILPAIYQRWETTKGAEMVQGTLARARQEARRSGRPTGVRLTAAGGTVSNLKFVQQPIDGFDPATAQAGDYLVPDGAGLPLRPPAALLPNMKYRVVRQPQLISGEREVKLPEKVGIDIARCSLSGTLPVVALPPSGTEPAPSGAPYYDIVFSPGGGITSDRWGTDKIILWVRDVTLADPTKGSPTLIVIYVRTGMIAAHGVDVTGAPTLTNPYAFCNDPRSSGL